MPEPVHVHYIGSCRCAGGDALAPLSEVRAAHPRGTKIEFVRPADSPWGRDADDSWQVRSDDHGPR